jgi:hypothetical protein
VQQEQAEVIITENEEEYDITVSNETTEQIAQLVLACKEFA